MNFVADCYELNDIQKYAANGIHVCVMSLPIVSTRGVHLFSKDEVKQAVQLAKEVNSQIALNMMRFFMEEELEEAKQILIFCKEIGVDLIYFSDIAILQMAKELGIENRCVYNPNTLITNASDANFYLSQGIHRVCLSKEITLEEMLEIGKKVERCEVSIHGRNIMMHSKRRLLSSYFEFTGLEDHSDSKALMIQESNREDLCPIFQDDQGTHVFSGFTLCSFKEIEALSQVIDSFRIECNFLTSDEVVAVVQDYMRVLNHEVSGEELYQAYQQKDSSIGEGFMYKKTSTVKEGA